MESIRKNGGGINIVALGILLLISLLISGEYAYVNNQYAMNKDLESNLKLHYIYMEAMYYLRNEIYEETFYDLSYDSSEVSVDIHISGLERKAKLEIHYKEIEIIKNYQFDLECHCIYE